MTSPLYVRFPSSVTPKTTLSPFVIVKRDFLFGSTLNEFIPFEMARPSSSKQRDPLLL